MSVSVIYVAIYTMLCDIGKGTLMRSELETSESLQILLLVEPRRSSVLIFYPDVELHDEKFSKRGTPSMLLLGLVYFTFKPIQFIMWI